MFNYIFYLHKFVSDIPLFNIPTVDSFLSDPDVIITKGATNYQDYLKSDSFFYLTKDMSIIKFEGGSLKIRLGKEIIYELDPGFDFESVTPFIMGWGLAIVLSQMGYSAFHCSALTRNNKCFFVAGVSGAGKSTTALELIKHGCKYLCDDIAIVSSFENMLTPPAFPIQKICPESSIYYEPDHLYAIQNRRNKYSYLNLKDYCETPKSLSMFFQIIPADTDRVEIKEITGIQKYYRVLENLFLEVQYALSSFPETEKFQCLKIAEKIRFFTVLRPKNKNTIEEITSAILSILDRKEI